jgi:hypothetical protein
VVKNSETGKIYKLSPKFNKKKGKYTVKFSLAEQSQVVKLTIRRAHKKAKIYQWAYAEKDDGFHELRWVLRKGSSFTITGVFLNQTYKFKIVAQNGKSKVYTIKTKMIK